MCTEFWFQKITGKGDSRESHMDGTAWHKNGHKMNSSTYSHLSIGQLPVAEQSIFEMRKLELFIWN
jgi:hypothetical protein